MLRNMTSLLFCVLAIAITSIHAYSAGAPPEVCDDMTPKHPYTPQKSTMPYKVSANSDSVSPGGVVKVTISGADGFKGFILEARHNSEPVGKFLVEKNDKYVKTIDCGKGQENAVSHKNAEVKNNLVINWQAPENLKEEIQFYVTVATDGATYWVRQPVAKVQIK